MRFCFCPTGLLVLLLCGGSQNGCFSAFTGRLLHLLHSHFSPLLHSLIKNDLIVLLQKSSGVSFVSLLSKTRSSRKSRFGPTIWPLEKNLKSKVFAKLKNIIDDKIQKTLTEMGCLA
jgi:hypothetical protein